MILSMAKDIEVEIRGILNKDQYSQAKTLFEKLASLKENKSRILIDYSTFLPGEGIRDRQKDIRVRVTNGIPEIVVKLGSWGGSESRRELSFKGKEGEFETLVEIFGQLGFTKGTLAKRDALVYDYKDIEFFPELYEKLVTVNCVVPTLSPKKRAIVGNAGVMIIAPMAAKAESNINEIICGFFPFWRKSVVDWFCMVVKVY